MEKKSKAHRCETEVLKGNVVKEEFIKSLNQLISLSKLTTWNSSHIYMKCWLSFVNYWTIESTAKGEEFNFIILPMSWTDRCNSQKLRPGSNIYINLSQKQHVMSSHVMERSVQQTAEKSKVVIWIKYLSWANQQVRTSSTNITFNNWTDI